MSQGWKAVRLGDVCDLSTGGTPPSSDPLNYKGGQIPWLVSGDVHRGEINECTGRITDVGFANSNARWLPTNSVVIALNGQGKTRGTVALLRMRATCNQSLVAISPRDATVLMPEFLFWNLRGRYEQIRRVTGDDGNDRRGLNMPLIRNISLSLPPLVEQQRIVATLDAAFQGIEAAVSHTGDMDSHLADLHRALIGSFVFGEFQGDWETVSVGELAKEKGSIRTGPFGSQLLHSEFVEQGVAVLGIDNVVANEFRWSKRRFITPEKYEELRRYTVRPGDVLISIMGTCGRCAVVPDDIPLSINTKHLCCISVNIERCLPEYLHLYFLHHPDARIFLQERAKGSIMAGLNMGIVKELLVRLPDLEGQRLILARYREIDAAIGEIASAHKRRFAALNELKQSLLARAFSGDLTHEPLAA